MEEIEDMDAVVFAVPHDEFKKIKFEDIGNMYKSTEKCYLNTEEEIAASSHIDISNNNCVLIDVKGMFDRKEAENLGYLYWRL